LRKLQWLKQNGPLIHSSHVARTAVHGPCAA
jgi:hypothetical protein